MKLKLINGIYLLIFCIILLLLQCRSGLQKKNNSGFHSGTLETAKFDFETSTQEWKSQNWNEYRGSYGVEQTSEYSKTGRNSLLLDCSRNSKGEAFVDLRTELSGPLNLEGKTIKCWILIPSDSGGQYGVQLYVKSVMNAGISNEQWFSEYSSWYDFQDRTGSWFEISLKPSIETPEGGSSERGFDPKIIAIIGIKISDRKASSSPFKGKVFLDDISW